MQGRLFTSRQWSQNIEHDSSISLHPQHSAQPPLAWMAARIWAGIDLTNFSGRVIGSLLRLFHRPHPKTSPCATLSHRPGHCVGWPKSTPRACGILGLTICDRYLGSLPPQQARSHLSCPRGHLLGVDELVISGVQVILQVCNTSIAPPSPGPLPSRANISRRATCCHTPVDYLTEQGPSVSLF